MLAGVSPFLLLGEEVMRPITVFSYVNQLNKFKVYLDLFYATNSYYIIDSNQEIKDYKLFKDKERDCIS